MATVGNNINDDVFGCWRQILCFVRLVLSIKFKHVFYKTFLEFEKSVTVGASLTSHFRFLSLVCAAL